MATVTRGGTAIGRPRTRKHSDLFQFIAHLAERRHVAIEDVAAAAGLARDTIYKIKDPRVSTLKSLSKALGVPLGTLASKVAAVQDGEDPAATARPNPRCR
jgi:transcriptional regulator with XRE-family HTH domain